MAVTAAYPQLPWIVVCCIVKIFGLSPISRFFSLTSCFSLPFHLLASPSSLAHSASQLLFPPLIFSVSHHQVLSSNTVTTAMFTPQMPQSPQHDLTTPTAISRPCKNQPAATHSTNPTQPMFFIPILLLRHLLHFNVAQS